MPPLCFVFTTHHPTPAPLSLTRNRGNLCLFRYYLLTHNHRKWRGGVTPRHPPSLAWKVSRRVCSPTTTPPSRVSTRWLSTHGHSLLPHSKHEPEGLFTHHHPSVSHFDATIVHPPTTTLTWNVSRRVCPSTTFWRDELFILYSIVKNLICTVSKFIVSKYVVQVSLL